VEEADVAEAPRQAIAWCLRQLPRLYRELARTAESRYADEITRLARAMLKALAGGAPGVAEALVARLHALHGRLGLPALDLKPPAPPKRPKRRAS
jgi:hypothetical protein